MGIKPIELEPSRENLLTTLSRDLLDRNRSVLQFARFCDAQEGKCSIAVDAKWGYGKTFFVRHVQMLLESFNPFSSSLSEEEKTKIIQSFQRLIGRREAPIEFEPQVCVYYDAWANDNDTDPVLSLVYEIMKGAAQHYEFKKSGDCLKAAALIFDFFRGKNISDLLSLSQEADPLAVLKSQKEIHKNVEEFLESLLFEQGNRLVIFVDELDRCKPAFAVQFLERIKHYFTNDRITFVFSVNIDELQHTVKCYYGDGFDACRYLDRFFDYRIALPPANLEQYYQEIGIENGFMVFDAVCKGVIEYCSFGLRETAKYFQMAKIAVYMPTHNNAFHGFSDQNALDFSLFTVVPLAIGLRMMDMDVYNDFISGKDPRPLISLLGNGEIARGICHKLLDASETYDDNEKDVKTLVQLPEKLKCAYQALFADYETAPRRDHQVGECLFTAETKIKTLRAASILSEYSSF